MRLSSLPTYAYNDAVVVGAACKAYFINPQKPVPYEKKLAVATYTGLSLRLVEKALTNIRKCNNTNNFTA